jgi:hypothetical protein
MSHVAREPNDEVALPPRQVTDLLHPSPFPCTTLVTAAIGPKIPMGIGD